ncbi:MAG: methionyl-tRNA formyltransferase [Myxococcales bacterium]|nr:methionyl-tRNA formyltransferase [Myxococcales bacterium]
MRIVFMGTPDFALPALESLVASHDVSLVVTQPDKPSGRKKKLTPPPVKVMAEEAGIEVLQSPSARTPEFLDRILEAKADVAVVVAYGKILPLAVLEAFPHGCVNIHGSLLPKYRGAAPIQWAVLDGEKQTGISIIRLDEGMDTGPVLLKRTEPIFDSDTAGSLFDRLAPLGASAVLEALQGLEAGTLVPKPQSEDGASHAAILKKQDGLIDWSKDSSVVACRIRGLDPWPGAFTPIAGGNLKLFGAAVCEGQGQPGAILGYDDEQGMVIACGEGAVAVADVQAPGKKRMAAAAFARGKRLEPGALLTPGGEPS